MHVVLNNSCIVQPAEPTWNGVMPLTELDQVGVVTHAPSVFFYRPSETWLTPKDTIFTTLRDSLSRILVHFYPLAGRLRWLDGSRLELECNGKGVQLTEVESDAELADLGDLKPTPVFLNFFPKINYEDPIEELPLLFVQLTKFKCGGIALSYDFSHAVVDGQSAFHFVTEWARLARGDPLGDKPLFDTKLLRAGNPPLGQPSIKHEDYDPPLLIGQSNYENERKKGNTVALLKLTKKQVAKIKNEADRTRPFVDGDRNFTRYEVVAAHIWRCACRARGHISEQPTGLGIVIDVRNRVQPPLPPKYFGNALVHILATGLSGDIVARKLGYAASRIREAINKMTSEYVHSTIDSLKNLEDLSGLQDIHAMRTNEGPFFGNPNLWVTSWTGLPIYGQDFGWGKEFFVSPGNQDCDGDSMILPGHDGDGSMVVTLFLQAAYMEEFKKFFYEDIETTREV